MNAMNKIREYAKAIAALLGAVATFLVSVNAPPEWSVWLGSAAAVLTGVATFGVPNVTDPATQIAKGAQQIKDMQASVDAQVQQSKSVLNDVLGGLPIVGPLAKQVGDLIP